MAYTITRAVYSIHYTRGTERGTMRFAGPDLETVRLHWLERYAPQGYRAALIERFSLRA